MGPEATPPPLTTAEAAQVYRDCIQRWQILERFPHPDWSIVDLWVMRELLRQGRTVTEIGAVVRLARAQAVSPQVESGNVYLPHPALGPWVEDLIEETAAFPHGRNDDQVDAMTQALNRLRSTSASYVVAESRITVNPFPVPEEWPRAFAMVVARDKVAAVWGARDRGGTIYLYAEHALPHAEPSENARAIRAHGDSIPGLIHIANASIERHRVTQLYQQVGLNVQSCASVDDAALFQFWHLLATNQLRVFASLSMFLEEYRIGEDQSPLLLCAHSLVSRPDLMMWQEPESADDDSSLGGRFVTSSPCYGQGAWMR